MILIVIRMKVFPNKRTELSQTIALLLGSIRKEKGCLRCDCYQNMDNEKEVCLFEEWDTRESVMRHLQSERFKVLRGAMNLLEEPYKMTIHTAFHPEGLQKS